MLFMLLTLIPSNIKNTTVFKDYAPHYQPAWAVLAASYSISFLGLHLDPMSVYNVHIACGLHLGTTLCHPHECNCGEMVESNGRHGLKCKKARGRKMRHIEVNKLIKRGLDQGQLQEWTEHSH